MVHIRNLYVYVCLFYKITVMRTNPNNAFLYAVSYWLLLATTILTLAFFISPIYRVDHCDEIVQL